MSRITFILAALTVSLTGLAPSAQGDVYKSVDAQGRVQYTDKPELLPAEKLALQSKRTDNTEVAARATAERERQTTGETARQQTQAAQADQQNAQQLTATAKAELCTKARERHDSYITSQRLYEQLPDGQRRYLTDAELTAARASAKAAMDAACN